MQCIWQTSARKQISGLGRAANLFHNTRVTNSSVHRLSTAFLHHRGLQHVFSGSITSAPPASQLHASLIERQVPPLNPKWTPNAPPPPHSLSRLVLSATRDVHQSLKEHALENAFLIVNSIRCASLPPGRSLDGPSWATVRTSRMHFPRGVSPRLPSHALLHGLVRLNKPQQASALAASMMKTGIRVRGKTVEIIVKQLLQAPVPTDAHLKHTTQSFLQSPQILNLNPSMSINQNTAYALALLEGARQSGSQRTQALFNMLITLCLINGEIIIASLLFGVLVKEWDIRSQALTRVTATPTPEEPNTVPPARGSESIYSRYIDRTPRPLSTMLEGIMASVRKQFERATLRTAHTPEFQEALQALANITTLLDNRQIPLSNSDSLLQALVLCPSVDNLVWVQVKGYREPTSVVAYRYFHHVLWRLVRSMPTKYPEKRVVQLDRPLGPAQIAFRVPDPVHHLQPALNSKSYSILIRYALQHRFSPAMATQLYEHMTTKREPSLAKSPETSSIVLRWGTLFRRWDMSKTTLEVFQQYLPDHYPSQRPNPKPMNLPYSLRRVHSDELPLLPTPRIEQVIGDSYALVAYLSALISSGHPHIVVHLMHRFLPIFASGHPDTLSSQTAKQHLWKESVIRAVVLGPHVLGVFLNAINKHGVPKKSHLMFKLILAASRASRDGLVPGKGKPWKPATIIYTMMLQAYKTEFERCRRRTGDRILSYLLRKTTELYHVYKQNLDRDAHPKFKPDSRFYNALLAIMGELLPSRKATLGEARHHLHSVRQQYAETGRIDDCGLHPLLEEIVADMQENDYPIPVGFQHLFVGRCRDLDESYQIPELDRRPFALFRVRKFGGPYTLPTYRNKGLPVGRRSRRRTRALRTAGPDK